MATSFPQPGESISSAATSPWRTALAGLGAAFVLALIFYGASYASVVEVWWRSETYAHGFLILPISAYLIWRRRESLARLTPVPNVLAAWLLLPLVMIWLGGRAADVQGAQHAAVVGMIPVLVWAFLGTQLVKAMAFPLMYLVFAIPFGQSLVPALQDFTAYFSVEALKMSNIPVYWEGRYFHIPSGSFEVAEACSGVRYLIASLALGSLYAYLTYYTWWRRAIFIALSLAVPIIANGMRAYGIVMLAHYSDYKLATGVDHLIYGWIFFGVVMMLLFWLGGYFAEKDPAEVPGDPVPDGGARLSATPPSRWAVLWLAVAPLLLSGPALAGWMARPQAAGAALAVDLPQAADGWQGPAPYEGDWRPVFRGAAVERTVSYVRGQEKVDLYLVSYLDQHQGAELINSQNQLFNDQRWHRVGESLMSIDHGDGGSLPVHALFTRQGSVNRVIWYWYNVGGTVTISQPVAKLLEARARLFRGRTDATLVAVSTSYEIEPKEARDRLSDFVAANVAQLKDPVRVHAPQ